MEIFHYLSNQLKGTLIFENDHRKIDKNKESGTVFNDFDFQPDKQLSSTHNDTVFGAICNSSVRFDQHDATFLTPQESVDHVVLEADRHEHLFYDAFSFEHSHYDISSSAPDKEYMEKVYKIATGGFKELQITRKVLEIFEMRQRGEWKGPDSVYHTFNPGQNIRNKMEKSSKAGQSEKSLVSSFACF